MWYYLFGALAALLILTGLWLVVPAGWKTRVYGALVFLAGLLEGVRQMLESQNLGWLTPQSAGGIMLGVGVAIVVLRQVTTTAPGRKE